MTSPTVSVGLPVFNGRPYIRTALESLLGQTYSDFELIVSDNASTDGTVEIVETVVRDDPRVRLIRNPRNMGVSRNFNRCFELARGRYFRWHGADDLVASTHLERCVEVLETDPGVVLVYPQTALIDAEGTVVGDYDDNLHLNDPSPSARFRAYVARVGLCNADAGLIRAESLARTGLFAEFVGSDLVLVGELTLHGRFHEIPERLFFRRFHPRASSALKGRGLIDYYGPDTGGTSTRSDEPLVAWRRLGRTLQGIRRAPIPLREKLRVAAFRLRMAMQERDEMIRQVRAALFPSRPTISGENGR